MLRSLRRSRLSEDAAQRVYELVEDLRLQPGDRLPSERDLSRQLCIARTSLREGLRTLELMGVIRVKPGKGIFLTGDAAAPLDRLIHSWLSAHASRVKELVELREALEVQAASLAASRAEANDVAAMEHQIIAMRLARDAADPERYVTADTEFHDTIARASRNRLLRRSLASIAGETLTYRMATARLGAHALDRSLHDHEAIFGAIRAADPVSAAEAMRAHIVRFPLDFNLLDGQSAHPAKAQPGDRDG